MARTPQVLNDANTFDTLSAKAMTGRLATWIVQVTAGAGTVQFRGTIPGSGVEAEAGPLLAYDNMTTGATVAGTTPAGVGLYRVPAENLIVTVQRASGAGTSVTYHAAVLEEG
jgi:hypothetical protein